MSETAKRVLIVEDEEASLNMLASYFEGEGFIVFKAMSSEVAEEILVNNGVDVILLDINLPGRDGFSLDKTEGCSGYADIPQMIPQSVTSI